MQSNATDDTRAPQYARRKQLAAILSVNQSTIWRWWKAGVLPAPYRLGGIACWDIAEVQAAVRATRDRA
jgi:predicted DNA-binding transcriptional regulator AlpA